LWSEVGGRRADLADNALGKPGIFTEE